MHQRTIQMKFGISDQGSTRDLRTQKSLMASTSRFRQERQSTLPVEPSLPAQIELRERFK